MHGRGSMLDRYHRQRRKKPASAPDTSTPGRASFFSLSSKYRVMATVEWASAKGLIHPAVTRDDDAASRIRIKNSRRCMTRPELDNAHSVCSRAGTRHCENQSKVITVAAQGHPVPSILSAPDNRPQMDFVSRDYETSNLADLAARPAWVPVTKLTASVAHHAMYKDKLLRPSPK